MCVRIPRLTPDLLYDRAMPVPGQFRQISTPVTTDNHRHRQTPGQTAEKQTTDTVVKSSETDSRYEAVPTVRYCAAWNSYQRGSDLTGSRLSVLNEPDPSYFASSAFSCSERPGLNYRSLRCSTAWNLQYSTGRTFSRRFYTPRYPLLSFAAAHTHFLHAHSYRTLQCRRIQQ